MNVNHARQTILVADAMKFERTAPVRIADISDIAIFVTDQPPPDQIVEICKANEIRLEIAADQEEPKL